MDDLHNFLTNEAYRLRQDLKNHRLTPDQIELGIAITNAAWQLANSATSRPPIVIPDDTIRQRLIGWQRSLQSTATAVTARAVGRKIALIADILAALGDGVGEGRPAPARQARLF